jgi:hypothetical protein
MSYDLVFWRQKKPIPSSPLEIYRKLNSRENMEGRLDLPGLAELPVDQILARLRAAYPDFDPLSPLTCFETQDGRYDVSWSKKHFTFMIDGDRGDSLNQLVGIMSEFGCPIFDPQENRRHDADHGLAVGAVPRFKSPTAEEKLERKQRYDAILKRAEGRLNRPERIREILKGVLGTCVAIALIVLIWLMVKR